MKISNPVLPGFNADPSMIRVGDTPPPRLVIAITMQLHRNRYDQFFLCALVGWVFSAVLGCHALAGWLR